jgi:nuclear transport factor 2 (NTF2) superfamily protein
MRSPLAPHAETNTTEKVRITEDTWNNADAVSDERRAAEAHDVRAFALKLAEVASGRRSNRRPILDGSHDKQSARRTR